MATLAELARQHTQLDRADIGHLQRLVGSWGMLADFSFSDLLLYARTNDERWVIVGQVRPVTSQTLYRAAALAIRTAFPYRKGRRGRSRLLRRSGSGRRAGCR